MKFIPTAILAVILFIASSGTSSLLPFLKDNISNFSFWWFETTAIIGALGSIVLFINAFRTLGKR